MSYTNNYFEMKDGLTGTTYRFRLLLEGAQQVGHLKLATYQRGIDGNLITVRSSFLPRYARGTICLRTTDSSPWGGLDQLSVFNCTNDLYVKMPSDDYWWQAEWMGNLEVHHLDPKGVYLLIPIQLEERV